VTEREGTGLFRAPDRPAGSGGVRPGDGPAVCPHCWMVNPAPFTLCARCGASMDTHLQESGGLRRTAPVQSPVPMGASARMGPVTRVLLALCVLMLALSYVAYFLPLPTPRDGPRRPAPANVGH
jgi:hypothetical protein